MHTNSDKMKDGRNTEEWITVTDKYTLKLM